MRQTRVTIEITITADDSGRIAQSIANLFLPGNSAAIRFEIERCLSWGEGEVRPAEVRVVKVADLLSDAEIIRRRRQEGLE